VRSGYLGDVVCCKVRCDGEMRRSGVDLDDDEFYGCVIEERYFHVEVTCDVDNDPREQGNLRLRVNGRLGADKSSVPDQHINLGVASTLRKSCFNRGDISGVCRNVKYFSRSTLSLNNSFGIEERLLETAEYCNARHTCSCKVLC
jgi:hypothetical protein